MNMRYFLSESLTVGILMPFLLGVPLARAQTLAVVREVEPQPFLAQIKRLIEASEYLGSPFSAADKRALDEGIQQGDSAACERIQAVLDAHCLFGVTINPENRVKVAQGPAKPELVEQGWRQFLVKVQNDSGSTAPLVAVSPNAVSLFESGSANTPSDREYRKRGDPSPRRAADLWLDLQTFDKQPLKPALSGLKLEYRIVQLFSRDAGKREGKFSFNIGQGTQDIGFRNEVDILFQCQAARDVTFRVLDESNQPTTATFLIRDQALRVYPSQAKRLAPDFAFHPQVYRADGEKIKLPDGVYTIELRRGPESIAKKQTVKVDKNKRSIEFKVERWIDPSKLGWWSGDHHIHAAGCAHYTNPTEGVHAVDMMRHCLGEDLKVGCNLTWGPCFDYQKQFFTGKEDKVSQYPYLLRYDIEVSGFGSHQSGHLVLLRLKEEIYPGGDSKTHWPTLGLNTLRWAKKQGAVTGPAHSGSGLDVRSIELPNYVIPPYNGIGANEFVVDVTHEVPGPDGKLVPAVDFTSTVDTNPRSELNMWYHVLNCGFRQRISGETDFPCIYGERVGVGRSYVKLDGKLDYDRWCEGIRQGRCYVSEGRSHLLEFKAKTANSREVAVGEGGSELRLDRPGEVKLAAQVAAQLDEQPSSTGPGRFGWHLQRARIAETRAVPVEVVVNGAPVARKEIVADGKLQ
ncbi:MAG: CehA/McbA family metallohydrolase, partial [Verrucomicrobiales bacterium]|nr:CehA/McbA family metallohydrolase [Verrucomicrobiales bacterium]